MKAEFDLQSLADKSEHDDFALMPRLRTAVVCLDPECEVIYPGSLRRCPACGEEGSWLLVNWIQSKRQLAEQIHELEIENAELRRRREIEPALQLDAGEPLERAG